MKGIPTLAILSFTFFVTVGGQIPKKCCLDDQWSAEMTDLSTLNSKTLSMGYIQADYNKQMHAISMMIYDPASHVAKDNGRVVFDYNKRAMYYIPANDTKTCVKTPIDGPEIRCIPDNAEFMGSSYLGPVAPGPMVYYGWRFKDGQANVTLAVTKDCIPLVEGVSTAKTAPQFQNQIYFFANYVPELTDPSQFLLPASCNK